MKNRNVWKQLTGLVFALAMIITAFVVASPEAANAAEYSFKNKGKSSVVITDENCSYVTGEIDYIKIKPKKDGYLKLKMKNASAVSTNTYGKIYLYNGKKSKALSPVKVYDTNEIDAYYYTVCYGLKKNTQYYVAVTSYVGVEISAEYKAVKDTSGTKKSKAKTIAKKKSAVGTIVAGTKSSDYYKFNVTSNQEINVKLKHFLTDDVILTVSGPGIKKSVFRVDGLQKWGYDFGVGSPGKVIPGTYYIKIQPATKTCSGYYNISWK